MENHRSVGLHVISPNTAYGPVLRHLIDNMHVAAFGAMLALTSSYLASDRGENLVAPPEAYFSHMDVLAFSTIGLFSSALSVHTFRHRFAAVAEVLEGMTVLFSTLTFAALAGVIVHVQHRRTVYILCAVPLVPLVQEPCWSLVCAFRVLMVPRRSPADEASGEQHWYLKMRRRMDGVMAGVAPRWLCGDTLEDIEGGGGTDQHCACFTLRTAEN